MKDNVTGDAAEGGELGSGQGGACQCAPPPRVTHRSRVWPVAYLLLGVVRSPPLPPLVPPNPAHPLVLRVRECGPRPFLVRGPSSESFLAQTSG